MIFWIIMIIVVTVTAASSPWWYDGWLRSKLRERKRKREWQEHLDDLTPEGRHIQEHGNCPDCTGNLLTGPSGGMSVNVKCHDCGNKFNIAAWHEQVIFVERI